MENRVRHVQLLVHAPAERRESSKLSAERFTRAVLDRFCMDLESRFPGRTILVRQLTSRWALSETEMADPGEASRCAAEMAASVSIKRHGALDAVDPRAAAVAFDDEAAWLASYLVSCSANASNAWYHAHWHENGLRDLLASPAGVATGVTALMHLAAAGELSAVLDRLPPSVVTDLARALKIDDAGQFISQQTDFGEPSETPLAMSTGTQVKSSLTRLAKSLPPHLTNEAAAVALRIHALASVAGDPVARHRIPGLTRSTRSEPDGGKLRQLPDVFGSQSVTAYGGLFYLLSIVLELGLGESLWKACLPEGQILARAMAALLGPMAAGDPAPALFGGVSALDVSEIPAIPPAQQAEVCDELLVALLNALSRRGTQPPPIFLNLVESPAGRLLAAFTTGFYVLFAWPAPNSAATAAGIDIFLKSWPRSAPAPEASNVLIALDQAGRLGLNSVLARPPSLLLPSAPTVAGVCLLAQICGSLAFYFGRRAVSGSEDSPGFGNTFVARFLTVPARVQSEPDALAVVLPMDCIELDLRRAALDRDPGWIPWLQRTVRLHFQHVASAANGD